ncbi:MAG: hypothetical protein E7394_01370 [Ruminococcaceae bacterium]|nr:hypothetical protein [Oscillospiraceae bacterium]
MKRIFITILIPVLIMSCFFAGCQVSDDGKAEDLIGTWVAVDADNQKLEIRTEELRFNYRRFDYNIKGNSLYLEETFPNTTIVGEMPFKLKNDTLTIELGDEFSGYFYGRSGTVEMKRAK